MVAQLGRCSYPIKQPDSYTSVWFRNRTVVATIRLGNRIGENLGNPSGRLCNRLAGYATGIRLRNRAG